MLRTGSQGILRLAACVAAAMGANWAMGQAPKPELTLTLEDVPQKAQSTSLALAKFEPEKGCYLGAYIELDPKLKQVYVDSNNRDRKLPEEFESIVGKPHAMYFFYQGYGTPLPKDWVKMLVDRNKFVHIAFEPNGGLDQVQNDAYLRRFADDLNESGAKVFLRFASEMNGDWTHYGGDPAKYREKFRLVADVMRERAPNVAMVWCPYTTPQRNISSYYPGDDWVDWVGVNMYNVTYFNQDPSMPARDVEPEDMLKFIYEKYGSSKPIMICEYGTTNFSRVENRAVPQFAKNNILSLYGALRKRYPKVKAINYFNSNNLLVPHAANNNYAVTADSTVLQAYHDAISSGYFLSSPVEAPRKLVPVQAAGSALTVPKVVLATLKNSPQHCFVRFLVDKQVAHSGGGGDEFRMQLDPSSMAPGQHTIYAEALDSEGRTIATQTMVVETAR